MEHALDIRARWAEKQMRVQKHADVHVNRKSDGQTEDQSEQTCGTCLEVGTMRNEREPVFFFFLTNLHNKLLLSYG